MMRASDGSGGPPSRLRARLREETGELHRALDAQLALLTPELSIDRYRRVLRALHGYYAALEPRLLELARGLGETLPLVARAGLLERDLHALGVPPEQPAPARRGELPSLRAREQLAGCLYVLEGARLGGRVIARALDRLGLDRGRGGAFFAGDGEPEGRWPRVVAWLDELGADPALDQGAIVAAAADTFHTLARWLADRGLR
jgi:heme oxygenase